MNKLTNQEIAQKVQNEGLGFCIQEYLDSDDIEDEHLASLWSKCRILMDSIDEILIEYCE